MSVIDGHLVERSRAGLRWLESTSIQAAPIIWQLIDSRTVGGAERHIALLAAGLTRLGFSVEVVLLANHGENPWIAQLESLGIRHRTLNGSLGGLVGALRRSRPDLVHTHGYKAGILGRSAAILLGIPRASTFHSGGSGPFPLWAYQKADEWTSCFGTRIAVSDPIARRLPYRAAIIPNWVASSNSPPSGTLPRSVAFVGRLSPEKGPDLFCELARRSAADVSWHAYGDGPMRAELEHRYGGYVHFHGIVTDLDPVWPTVGLLCMPSRQEGVPLAALEALSAGIPVLASDVGGLPTVITQGETGWLFPSGALEHATVYLGLWRRLSDDADTIRLRCWTRVRDHFSENRLLPRILESYGAAGLALSRGAA